jgi:uncharacterized protein YvpB
MSLPVRVSGLLLPAAALAASGCQSSMDDSGRKTASYRAAVSTPNAAASGARLSGTPTACDPGLLYGSDGSPYPAPTLPPKVLVSNIHGTQQALPLDCETNPAVDWAAYFGVTIDELEFFRKIPPSGDPNGGFVGDVKGPWGNLPPQGCGVYAGPVALLLRYYGLEACACRALSWDELRSELAAGRPMIVWVTGHIWKETPVTITVAGGAEILAARFEHTMILIGYADRGTATVLDETSKYSIGRESFLTAWGALGKMGILGRRLPARQDCTGGAADLVPGAM